MGIKSVSDIVMVTMMNTSAGWILAVSLFMMMMTMMVVMVMAKVNLTNILIEVGL